MKTENTENELMYTPRGIGFNWIPCFVCGGEDTSLKSDMAAFVENKESGEKVVELFKSSGFYAKLDYRDFEPDWVQVKIGACKDHQNILEDLYTLTCQKKAITKDILNKILEL